MQSVQHHTRRTEFLKPFNLILLSIVTVVLLTSLWQRTKLGYSAGHMDEYDYLFVGKTLLADLDWPTHRYIFGSDLSWYLFGWGENYIGGIVGARAMAAMLGLLSLVGCYFFARELWQSNIVALIATMLLAVSASHIFISRLASYDSVSFAFFTLAMMPLLRSCRRNIATHEWLFYLTTGSLLLLAAVLSKYTTAAYLPFIGLVMLYAALARALIGGTIIAMGLMLYMSIHWSDLLILFEVQIGGTHGENTIYSDIVSRSASYTAIPILLTLIAIHKAKSHDRNTACILVILLVLSCPLFLYHLHGKNLISLYKHLVFSLFFLVNAAAWLLVTIAGKHQYPITRSFNFSPSLVAFLISLYTATNLIQLKTIENGFPDLGNFLQYMNETPLTAKTRILSEEPYVFRYLQFDQHSQHQINESTWLDTNHDGIHSHEDVLNALRQRTFEVVLLTDAIHPAKNKEYRHLLTEQQYRIVYSEPYQLSAAMTGNQKGTLTLYRRKLSSASAVY